jgi:hypothetical protein
MGLLNNTTPTAPIGRQNIEFATDSGTPARITGSDPVMVGDTGSGGLAGNVPAPPAGSAALGHVLKADGTFGAPGNQTGVLGITVDGGQSTPTSGNKGYLKVPYNCTITGWTLIADQIGSVTFDIKTASSLAGIGATSSIIGSTPPTLVSAQAADNTALTGWTTTLTTGMLLEFDVTSISTLFRVTLELTVRKT